MKKRTIRGIAAVTTVAMGSLALELVGPSVIAGAAGTVISVQCNGIDGDVAGQVSGANKTSKELVGLLSTLSPGTTGLPPLPVTVNVNAPEKVKKGSGDFDASFEFSIAFPDSLVKAVRDTLKKSSLNVTNATIGVDYSGPVSGSLEAKIASQTIDLTGPSPSTSVQVSGKIPTDKSGRVFFRPGTFNISAEINGEVAGLAKVGTLGLTCSAQGLISSTAIQVPGAPNTPALIEAPPIVGGYTAGIPILSRPDITPDDNNPIQPETLKVISSDQGAFVKNGWLVQPTPEAGGTIVTDMEVCAPERPIPEVPGTDEVQAMEWNDTYFAKPLNAHPLSMTLKFKDLETKPISLSTLVGGIPGTEIFGNFAAPSAATVQKALEALPTIGAGNIAVTKTATGGYEFAFKGALATADQPDITVGTWKSQAPYELYGKIQAAIQVLTAPKPPADPNQPPDPSKTDKTVQELQADLVAGKITFEQFGTQFGSALGNSIIKGIPVTEALDFVNAIFPQPPAITTKVVGEPTIPATTTGPLCSQFQVKTVAVSKVFLFFLWLRSNPQVLACTVKRVPYKARVHSNGRTRYVTRYRTVKSKACKAKTTKKVTKRTRR